MSVARNKRRLLAARRYVQNPRRQEHVNLSSIGFLSPVWSTTPTDHDIPSALRAIVRLARRRMANLRHEANQCDDGTQCQDWPPCGGCGSCARKQVMYYGQWINNDMILAHCYLERRINPNAERYIRESSV